MSGSAKVVPLNPGSGKTTNRTQAARLPAPIHQLQEKGKYLLSELLRKVFDNADDALFDLADKAASNQEQNLYFDSMREVRIRRRQIEACFAEAIDNAFAQLVSRASAVDTDDEFSLDNLSLVQNDELEQLVAADTMVSKAAEQYSELVQHLSLRIDSLVPLKVYHKNNPLGPDIICHAFVGAAETLSIDIKAKLVLFKLFDKFVVAQLGKFYTVVNKLLIEQNVLPSLKQVSRKRSSRQGRGRSAPSAGLGSGAYSTVENKVLHTFRELIGGQVGQAIAVDTAGAVAVNDLVGLLSTIQSQQYVHSVAESDGAALAQLNIRQLLGQLVEQNKGQQKIGQVDDDVINLVNMMFEFILDDRNLAEPMKVMIARLQIPIIKVAIADKTFFNKGGHPARRLLNELATAALGWQDDGKRQDPLYKKISVVVQRILDEFHSDIEVFSDLLADFISFVEKENRRASILEQRIVDAEDGKAKAEAARLQVAQALQQRLPQQCLPPAVETLLQDAWSNVLFLICLKQGTDSKEWKQSLQTVEDLIWSVALCNERENRPKLLKLIPNLLKRLRNGLESIAYNPFEMTQLFKALEKLHIEKLCMGVQAKAKVPQGAVKTRSTPVEKPSPMVQRASPSPVLVSPGSVSPPERVVLQRTAEPVAEDILPEQDGYLLQVDKLTQGTWFEMTEEGHQSFRCRLAAIIKPTGKYIFANRSGVKVAEKTRNSLALALKNKALKLLDDGMLFDRALEAVIGNLRSSRTSTS